MTYTHKTLFNCNDLYQQGTGANWQNLVYARTGDGYGSYVYPQGSKSKTEYKPKDLCYIYKYNELDPNKHKVCNVYFTIVFRYHNTSKNDYPKIRVYTGKKGDNTFIQEISAYTKLENRLELDNHTIQYKIPNLTIDQLKSLLIKVVWSKTKSTEASTISINRARLAIYYAPLEPKISLYASPSLSTITNNDEFTWTLTAKNTGDCGSGQVTINLPSGVTLLSNNKNSSFNPSTKKWVFSLCNGKSDILQLRLKFPYVGRYTLTATNDNNAVNSSVSSTVNVEQYYPSSANEKIVCTFYPSFAYEDSYFDIGIWGVYNGEKVHCYDINIPNGLNVEYPLSDSMIDLNTNSNVERFITSQDTEYSIVEDNRICFAVNDTMANFEAHIRIPFHSHQQEDFPIVIHSNDSGNEYTGILHILEPRGMRLIPSSAVSMDKRYVFCSMNIGSPHIWSVRARASSKNFFDEKKDNLAVDIEKMIAFIGVVPLSRSHSGDVTSDAKNTLIANRYLNRSYYGKKGDFSKDIKLTLRLPWYDVATLEGLCEMDKPVPIDTVPTLPDGDPLNHRGWAELHGVNNVKKINNMLYQCDVDVTYLTHKIITMFGITEGAKITANAIKYYLALTHDYTDDILELFRPSYYQMFTSLEDISGNILGSWEMESPSSLTLYNKNEINKYSTWDIIFRNHLPVLMSEDFDGNWEMAFRIVDKANDRRVLFEHTYNNFKHYDFDNNKAINTADVTSTYLNGNVYETLNFDKVGLGYDSLVPIIEDRKTPTHFNTMESINIKEIDDKFEIFLLDDNNKGVANQVVRVSVNGSDGFKNRFNVITDIYGRILFDVAWGNGDYNVALNYDETEKYRSCSYSTNLNVNFDYVQYHFEYPSNVTAYVVNYPYVVTLLDDNEDPVPNIMLHFSFKTATGDYGYERTRVTDENGQISIPIDWLNGTNTLKVSFKGFTDNGVVYQPIQFEEDININIPTKETFIESDDVEGILGYKLPRISCILKDIDGNPLVNKRIFVSHYNDSQTIRRVGYTNEFGMFSENISVVAGAWKLDLHFDGDDEYRPSVTTVNVTLNNFEQLSTYMTSENYRLNQDEVRNGTQNYYTLHLWDVFNNPVINEPISIEIYKDGETYPSIDMVLRTDDEGKIEVPFLDRDCNVTIISTYHGCTRYDACINEDVITFDDVQIKNDVYFRVHESNTYIEVKYGNGEWNGIWQDNQMERVIVNHPNDYRYCTDGMYYYYSMNANDYKVTLFYKGSNNFYAKTETLEYHKVDDSRKTFAEWVQLQEGASANSQTSWSQSKVGNYTRFVWDCDCEVPYSLGVIFFGINSTSYSDDLYNRAESVVCTVPEYYQAEDGHTKTRFEFYGIMPSNGKLSKWVMATDYIKAVYSNTQIGTESNSDEDVTLTQDGFAYENETFQNINVLATNGDSEHNANTNNWFNMKLLNLETLEEFSYQSYYVDNVTPINIKFELEKSLYDNGDNWELEITSKESPGYKGAYLRTTGRIDTDTIIEPSSDFIINEDNFTQLGDEISIGENGFGFYNGGGFIDN